MFSLLLILAYCANTISSANIFPPCNINDLKCQEKAANVALPSLFAGNPELGVDSSDPLYIKEIVGNISGLTYKLMNCTFTGGRNAYVENVIVDKNFTKALYDMIFPKTMLSGKYEVAGNLFTKNIDGSGNFTITTGKYKIGIDSEFWKIKGKDGKTHVSTISFSLKYKAVEPVTYSFENLFNDDVSDSLHKFVNENWEKVTKLAQGPVWSAVMKETFKNFNEYLKYIAHEDFITQ